MPAQLFGVDVDVEAIDAVEDSLGVVDDATHGRAFPYVASSAVTHRISWPISW
jgi:hypothetical protein